MKVDPNKMQNINQDRKIPQVYDDVATGMETQFIHQMITEMKKSVPKEEKPSSAQEFYENLHDYEVASQIAKSPHGIGIKEMILKQIYPEAFVDLKKQFMGNKNSKVEGLENNLPSDKGVQNERR
jgi:Rod binding domain-containing protein